MRRGAELRIGTDIGEYARAILLAVRGQRGFSWTAQGPRDWRERPADWPPTRYEQKALRRRPPVLPISAFAGRDAQLPCDEPSHFPLANRAQFLPTISALMIISTLRVGPLGPLFLFWAIGSSISS